jgi:Fe-S cluster assembly iron-binding protein IscA
VLQVSETAVAVLEEARSAQELPDSYGVRISGQPAEAGQIELMLGFAEGPGEGDEVTEQAGTEIYVAPEVAEPLADSKLDLENTPEGPQLVIKPQ